MMQNRLSKWHSRSLVLLTALTLLSIGIGLTAITSYNIVKGLLLNSLKQEALLKAEQGRDNIDQWLSTRKAEIATLANSSEVNSMDWLVMEPHLQSEVKRFQTFLLIALVTSDGVLVNTQGGHTNVKDREFFNRSMLGETVVADPIIGRTSGKLQIQISSPIFAKTNVRPAGVLMGGISISRVVEAISDLHQGDGSYAFALNSKGVPIAHPDISLIGSPEKPANTFLNSTNSELAKIAQQMVSKQTNIELVQLDGKWNYVAYTPLKEANWSVALVVPQANIESPLQALNLLAAVLGVLLVIGLIGAWKQLQLYEQIRARARFSSQQAQQLTEALKELRNAQAQLLQTEKMSSLGQLVAGVAHEINNPINFIHGNLNHLSEYSESLLNLLILYQQTYPDPPPQIRDHAEELDVEFLAIDLPKLIQSMRGGTDRIRQIVLSLRNVVRSDEVGLKRVDIHEGLDNTLLILANRLQATANQPKIQIIKKYDCLPLAECYAGQLNQAFINILNNAIDAVRESTQSSPSIIIQTFAKDENWICVSIADNGVGILEKTSSQIFDPFFTTKPVGKGTGLGLTIAYQIVVEKHGGAIEVNSTLDAGTEFVTTLPIKAIC